MTLWSCYGNQLLFLEHCVTNLVPQGKGRTFTRAQVHDYAFPGFQCCSLNGPGDVARNLDSKQWEFSLTRQQEFNNDYVTKPIMTVVIMINLLLLQDERLAVGRGVVRLPCHHPIRRDVVSLQSSHDGNQEARSGTDKLKSSSEHKETEPLIAAAVSKHSSSYGGHSSSTKHDGSFEDFNNIHLISPTHHTIN